MENSLENNHLSEKRQVTVILRLLLDGQGRLEHGEIVAVNGKSEGRFAGWNGLVQLLSAWLISHENK